MLYMAPIAVVALIPAVLIMEPTVLEVFVSLGNQHKFMLITLILNSLMAYGANLSNFLVTKYTSALTLQVWHPLVTFLLFLMFIYLFMCYF